MEPKEDIDSVFDTQVKGTAYITKAVLTQMARQKSGRIYTVTHYAYRIGIEPHDPAVVPKTLHLASLFGKAAIADLVALEAQNYGVRSIPVFIRSVSSNLDIDDKRDPNKKSNHPNEVTDAIIKDLSSEKSSKEIIINTHV